MQECGVDVDPVADVHESTQLPGYWMWGVLFAAIIIFEVIALLTKHRTLSQTVQLGPRWFKWAMGVGLVVLIAHLFL